MGQRHRPERDPHSAFEDEGIPDLQEGTPGQGWAVDPQRAPVPADQPVAVDDYGTTPGEQSEGEPLDSRVGREEPEDQAMFGGAEQEGDPAVRPAGRLVAPDEGAHPHTEHDAVAHEAGPDMGGYTAEESAMRVEPEK